MFKAYTRPLLTMDREARDKRVEGALHLVDFVGDRCPDLAVTWASSVLYFTRQNHQLAEQAVACVAHYLPAAYALDPDGAREAALTVHVSDVDRRLRLRVQQRLFETAPVLQSGPWGLAPEGRRQILADYEASRSPWNRWSEKLGDLKHRILHPPGPNDVTFPAGESWPGKPRDDGPAPPGP